jgi:hypothetical protein
MIRCKATTPSLKFGELRCQLWRGHGGQHYCAYPSETGRWLKAFRFVWQRADR